jgi:putative transposase
MPRRPRFSTANYVFHVLNRGAGRRTLFTTEQDYDAFVALLDEARQHVPMRLLSFCVMPNHWHLILWPETDDALSEYMRWLGTTHAQRWNVAHGATGTGPVYQGRFKSFPVQEDEHFLIACRYVERNALRANLVSRAESWKWSSVWHRVADSASIALAAWPVPRPSEWLEHVNQPQTEAELGAIRHSVIRGRPFGTRDWTQRAAKALGIAHTLRLMGRQPG